MKRALLLLALAALPGCATIPGEAPELSAQLGNRISAVEAAHQRLLADYFTEKRRRVDEFVQEEWIPEFAAEFFSAPSIAAAWDEIVRSNDPKERLKFVVIAGPQLQAKLNAKRTELIQPLDELERTVAGKLRAEYNQMRAINGTLTAFLQSAAKVEENRKRYLEMLGVSESRIESFIDDTDAAVSRLVDKTGDAKEKIESAQAFRDKIREIANKVRS